MKEMNSRERVLCACRLGVPDRIPRFIEFEHGFADRVRVMLKKEDPVLDAQTINLNDYFKNDCRIVGINPTREKADFSHYFGRSDLEFDEWGRGRKWDNTRHYAEYYYPLAGAETLADIESYPWPDMLENYRYIGLQGEVSTLHEQGYAVMGGPSAFFEIAWQIRSMERLMEDMVLNPELAEAVFNFILIRNIRYAVECAKADVDILYLGDDVAMQTGLMMDPALWRKYLGKCMRSIIIAAREIKPDILVWYHSDGNITTLIPDLIDAGVNILNPVQPECCDAEFVKGLYGDKLAFWGGLGVQSIIPLGTPEDVCQHVRSQIEILGKNGGYVVGPSHILERDTPWENFKAMIMSIEKYGNYY